LSGKPEARFEAYARGYAGCGPYTTLSYRRSYGRNYEAICCSSSKADDKYLQLYKERPYDIIGRYCRLEALEAARHLDELHKVTSGAPAFEKTSYDPEEVWGFLSEGPFESSQELRKSFVFQNKRNEAAFAIVDSVTNQVVGACLLTNDSPKHLTIQIEPPILHFARVGTTEQLEACFLLMDRLFAFGYRRIQMSTDSQDTESHKLAARLGFTLEGVLYKHLVFKDASRDSNVYSMLNSDWKQGARSALFKKLYGASALSFDTSNERKEEELAEQSRYLAEVKRLAAEEKKTK
jgi:RimJ/RimL family protein N-acetyltransferase